MIQKWRAVIRNAKLVWEPCLPRDRVYTGKELADELKRQKEVLDAHES